MSISQYSKTKNTDYFFVPTATSLKPIIFGCYDNILSILTYLREVIGKPSFLSKTFIFFIATYYSVFLSFAKNTIPYVP